MLRAMVAGGVATALPTVIAQEATAAPRTTNSSLAGYYIGGNGRLYAAGATTAGAVSTAVIGPAGGNVSTVQRSDGVVAVFTIGSHGGLLAGFGSAGGSGMSFVRHSQGGLATPGGKIAAVEGQTGTHVHFTGTNGAIYHAMFARSGAVSIGPAPVVLPGSVLPSTSLAAFRVGDRFGVAYVGGNGSIQVSAGSIGMGGSGPIAVWTTTAATPANAAPRAAPVAAASESNRVAAFYTGTDGSLWRIPFSGVTPQPQVALSGPGAVPLGAHLAATLAPTGEFAVTYAGADGAINAATNAYGPRADPWIITPPAVHAPGNPLALTYGGDDYLYVGWCGNDIWFWLIWWWLRRPFPVPPPPDPFHELQEITSPILTRPGFNVSIPQLGAARR